MEISEVNPDGNVYQLKDSTARAEIAQIKAQEVYSATETDTGQRWVDGKTIYRIVKPVANITMTGGQWHGLLNETFVTTIDVVTRCAFLFTYSDTNKKTLHYPELTRINGTIFETYNTTGFGLVKNASVIIEYTKV